MWCHREHGLWRWADLDLGSWLGNLRGVAEPVMGCNPRAPGFGVQRNLCVVIVFTCKIGMIIFARLEARLCEPMFM